MDIVYWILIGAVAGMPARRLMPGPSAGGLPVAIGVGIAGAVAGGVIAAALGGGSAAAGEYRSLIVAICGSLAALIGFRAWALRQGD